MIRVSAANCKPERGISRRVFSRPMGSSGKKRKDKRPLPKVGTPQERAYAHKRGEADVAGNFGIHGKGWMFWTAVVVLVAIVAFSLLGWIFWF